MKVAIMAGGTDGHIFPGIAVAKELINQNVEIVWLGAVGGMEENIVKKHGITIHLLTIKGLRGKGLKGLLTMPFKLFGATRSAGKFLKKEKVSLVVSMGGYVAGPGGLAARLKRIPMIVHEQNSKFGMTNKYLSRWARKVLTGFNSNGLYNSVWVGNPVRQDIEDCKKTENSDDKVRVLIIGGSLGAKSLNTRIPGLLKDLIQSGKILVKHQCGKNNQSMTQENYQSADEVEVVEFIDDMAAIYSWADLIIARAGALTIAEINAVGLPAIFVPYPYAVDDHQTSNAKLVVDSGAAYIWQESDSEEKLSSTIKDLVENVELRKQMSEASKKLHKPNCAKTIADICMEVMA